MQKLLNVLGITIVSLIGMWYVSQFLYAFGLVVPPVKADEPPLTFFENTLLPEVTIELPDVDLSRLADAVAMHETKYCTSPYSPTANARNNCWGIMKFWVDEDGNRHRAIRRFSSIEEGKQEFIRLWSKSYKKFPTYNMAVTYSGNDKAIHWLNNVKHYYETL